MTASLRAGEPGRPGELWLRFILWRVLRLVVVVAGVVIVTFLMVHLVPGNPARLIAGFQADAASVAHVERVYLLNRPLLVQFAHYLSQLAHLSLGQSYVTQQPVSSVIAEGIGPSSQLVGLALALVLCIGIPLGIVAGVKTQNGERSAETVFGIVTGILSTAPSYLAGTALAFLFAVLLRWFPVAGTGSLRAAVLPAIAISIYPVAMVARVVRTATVDVLAQDYIRTARSKRLSPLRLYCYHVLPNVLTAALTVAGVVFASLIGGTVMVEQVFARAGLGTDLVQAVLVGNYPVVQGITMLVGIVVVTVNTVVDVVLAMLDPRTLVALS
jgi:peptide/nickel transport system permease protein